MALNPNLIKKIIFDLDDTLFDTNGQLVQVAAREACQVMIKAGLKATQEECLNLRNKLLLNCARGEMFENIAKHFGVEGNLKSVAKAGSKQFHNREIKEKIFLFPEALEILKNLQKKYELFLVTLGGVATQKKKIELLGLAPFFNKIYFVDIDKEKTKTNTFKEILRLSPPEEPRAYLSIGNRIDSEIRDAKALGMQTVLLAHGEYVNLKPQSQVEEPDVTIKTLKSLLELL